MGEIDALRWLGHTARIPSDKLPGRLLTAWVYKPKGIKNEFKLGMRRLDDPALLRVPAQEPNFPSVQFNVLSTCFDRIN